MQLAFQLISKVIGGVEIRAQCKTLKFHCSLGKACLHEPHFVHRGTVKGSFNATPYKDIPYNCVLPTLWQQFGGRIS